MLTRKLLIAVIFFLFMVAGIGLACSDVARGQELAVECANCHGDNGLGDEDIPRIAGLENSYIVAQLKAFKSGEREDLQEMMLDYVEGLSDQDIVDLASYWSSLPGE